MWAYPVLAGSGGLVAGVLVLGTLLVGGTALLDGGVTVLEEDGVLDKVLSSSAGAV